MTSFSLFVCHNVHCVIICLFERIGGHFIIQYYYFIYYLHNFTNQYQYLSHLSLQYHWSLCLSLQYPF